MKICWDMLEGVYLTRNGTFRKGSDTYIEVDFCERCGEPYLALRQRSSSFCSNSCANSGEGNSMYGKTHSIRTRKKISENKSNIRGGFKPQLERGYTYCRYGCV